MNAIMGSRSVLCFGDSLTWGFNPVDGARFPFNVRWPGVVQATLGADYRIIEKGLSGCNVATESRVLPNRAGRAAPSQKPSLQPIAVEAKTMREATHSICRLSLALALTIACPAAFAETEAAGKPVPCSAPEYRQFDFWRGDWDVHDPSGKIVGRNRIVALHGGCALQESWTGASGHSGTSLNLYDSDRKRWHQTWVDSNGGVLELDGGIVDGAMVLRGETMSDGASKATLQRITWTPQRDGRVRQLWESSNDGGKTWDVVFDGMYSKKT